MLTEISGWLPETTFRLACDGAYGSLVGAGLPRAHVTSRLRRDAAVHELTPPRTGRPGRPRKKGDRHPPLAELTAQANDWASVIIDQRGTPLTRHVWARRLPVVRRRQRHPAAARRRARPPTASSPTTTSSPPRPTPTPPRSPATTPDAHPSRSPTATPSSTSTPRTPRAGGARAPSGSPPSPSGCTPPSDSGTSPPTAPTRSRTPTPWYPSKTTPSFADALAALRQFLWQQRIHHCRPHSRSPSKPCALSSTPSPEPPSPGPHAWEPQKSTPRSRTLFNRTESFKVQALLSVFHAIQIRAVSRLVG